MSRPSIFPWPLRLLHWLMAVALLGMLFVGVSMVASVEGSQPTLLAWHKSLGVLLLVLAGLRLLLRLLLPTPPLPADMPVMQRLAAQGSHVLLYALMLIQPLVGWAMQSAAGYPLELFGQWPLPALLAEHAGHYSLLREAHAWLAYTLFAVILLHLAAGLYHGLVRRDGVLEAMLGRSR